jgi:hypothetical protein
MKNLRTTKLFNSQPRCISHFNIKLLSVIGLYSEARHSGSTPRFQSQRGLANKKIIEQLNRSAANPDA